MNEFEYINFQIQDINPKTLLYNFCNGYRFDATDIRPKKYDPSGTRLVLGTQINDNRDLNNIAYTKYKSLDHSWEPIDTVLDAHFWELLKEDQKERWGSDAVIVLHSEESSKGIDIIKDLGFQPAHWFAHGYLCSNHWFRLYKDIKVVTDYRSIEHPWVCMNRLIDHKRIYRIEFLNMLELNGIYSLQPSDPQTGRTLAEIYPNNKVKSAQFDDGANSSAWITVNKPTPVNTSFLHVVTETVVDRVHLTEKIFKPIVLNQPFVLVGGAGCLKYLQHYGFKTFSDWWDESYDDIQDTTQRMQAVADIVNWIGSLPISQLEELRAEMTSILEYNYKWFYAEFSTMCWDELVANLQKD